MPIDMLLKKLKTCILRIVICSAKGHDFTQIKRLGQTERECQRCGFYMRLMRDYTLGYNYWKKWDKHCI